MKKRSKMWLIKQKNNFNTMGYLLERWNQRLKKIFLPFGNFLVSWMLNICSGNSVINLSF